MVGELLRTWRHLPEAIAALLDDVTVIGRLRVAALHLDMPLDQVTGEELEKGLHALVTAVREAGVSWDEAARRITTPPSARPPRRRRGPVFGVDKETGTGAAVGGPDPDD
jgi:hypothetical protein